jgi:hypothetical protein
MMGGEHVTRAPPRTAALSSVGAQFQAQSIQPDKNACIALVVSRCVAFHRSDFWIVKTLRALAAEDDSHGAD